MISRSGAYIERDRPKASRNPVCGYRVVLDGGERFIGRGREKPDEDTLPFAVVQRGNPTEQLHQGAGNEPVVLDLTVQIGVDANRVPEELWKRLHEHFTEPQIVEAVYTITQYIAISKFGDALGVELEPVFQGQDPILHVGR